MIDLGDRTRAAREFHAAGGPVVGFLSNDVPIELLHAAGCFPLQLPPAPGMPTPRADEYMEDLFDPMARSVFERLLTGELGFVDAIVLPRGVDSFQRLYYYLCELRRCGTERVPETWLFDLLKTPWRSSADYNLARTRELAARLQALTGRELTDAALRRSIAQYNRVRRKLSAALGLRRCVPSRLPGAAALDLLAASQLAMPEDFEPQLDALLARGALDPVPGARVVVAGSAHDQPALHARIAAAGGQVVADYHWRGDLLFGAEIDEHQPPLTAICRHYHLDVIGARTYPTPVDGFVDFVRAAQAQGVVFFYYAAEEALTWDHVPQRQALDAIGVPWLCLSMQAYPPDPTVDAPLREFCARIAPTPLRAEA